ncbi:MAG: hypothetical protein ACI90V_014367, partial [Bacillariaceae sp.]
RIFFLNIFLLTNKAFFPPFIAAGATAAAGACTVGGGAGAAAAAAAFIVGGAAVAVVAAAITFPSLLPSIANRRSKSSTVPVFIAAGADAKAGASSSCFSCSELGFDIIMIM